jgi:hypothetical protein
VQVYSAARASAQAYPASYAAGLASESLFTADQSAQACTATYAADPTSDFSAQAVPVYVSPILLR